MCRGDFCGVFDLECRGGLRGVWRGFGGTALVLPGDVLIGDLMVDIPIAELFLVDGVELPESEAVLRRRAVLMGIRDCEFRFEVFMEVVGEEEWDTSVPYILEVGGYDGTLSKSLRRRWIGGRSGISCPARTSSRLGTPSR